MKKDVKMKFEELVLDSDKGFDGWDFTYLSRSGRMQESPLSWNYYNIIKEYCNNAESLLDMGTGGGEFLSKLSFLPKYTCATEGYEPNVKIAKECLEPLGIKVCGINDNNNLPIESDEFDLVINRHESFSPSEVKRILKKDGYFITQQVGGLNDLEFNMLLGANDNQYVNWNLSKASIELLKYGFKLIEMKEDKVKTRFYDIGAIIYYFKAIPWQIPDFSVEKYRKPLESLHDYIEKQGYIDVTCHRFLIISQRT